jgi:glycosyltransferase involved in cell wall biosynthesis
MKQTLTIGLDAKRIVRNGTGLGSYGRTLANDLASIGGFDLRLYAPDKGRDDLRQQVPERENLHFCYPPDGKTAIGKAIWRSWGVTRQLRRDGVQVYHGLSGELPIGISRSGIRSVVTIHDLIFLRHPEYYNPIDVWIYTRKLRQTLREADCIVAISECTQRDIIELGHVAPSRIRLVYQSCAPRFSAEGNADEDEAVSRKYQLPQRYVLSVGSIEERKNIGLAVKALHHLPEEVCLVAVGRQTDYARRVLAEADRAGLSHRVLFLSGVPDEDLPAIYRCADTFVYPSRYEGFGIPIIEAIGCHLPVVACTGSCLEEAGGPDSLYVAPDDDKALANAITQTLRGADGREQRIIRSREYIRRFEGNDVAGQIAAIYEELKN